jgi:hypothetical protein
MTFCCLCEQVEQLEHAFRMGDVAESPWQHKVTMEVQLVCRQKENDSLRQRLIEEKQAHQVN